MPGTLLSVNVALPGPVLERDGRPVVSAILKRPVLGRVRVLPLGLEGDGVGNRVTHGGPRKSVYAYPSEHYAFWQQERPEQHLGPGGFGENLTLAGLLESAVRPGDRLRIGSAAFRVTQPRYPCATLALKFGRPGFLEEFQRAGRSGFYLSVERTGELGAGDPIEVDAVGPDGPTIDAIYRAKAASTSS